MTPDQEIRAKALELALSLYRGGAVQRADLKSDADWLAEYILGIDEKPLELYCCGARWHEGHRCTPNALKVQCPDCSHPMNVHSEEYGCNLAACVCVRHPSAPVPAPRSALDAERCGCTHTWDVHTAWDGCTFDGCACVNSGCTP